MIFFVVKVDNLDNYSVLSDMVYEYVRAIYGVPRSILSNGNCDEPESKEGDTCDCTVCEERLDNHPDHEHAYTYGCCSRLRGTYIFGVEVFRVDRGNFRTVYAGRSIKASYYKDENGVEHDIVDIFNTLCTVEQYTPSEDVVQQWNSISKGGEPRLYLQLDDCTWCS